MRLVTAECDILAAGQTKLQLVPLLVHNNEDFWEPSEHLIASLITAAYSGQALHLF